MLYYIVYLSKPDLDRLLNKALQAPSLGGDCVIPTTVPYLIKTPNIRRKKSYMKTGIILDSLNAKYVSQSNIRTVGGSSEQRPRLERLITT